ncbi:MAG: hypothetical protein WBQ86_23105 [Candidatus Binatus sp.]
MKRTIIVAIVSALSIPLSGCFLGPHPVTYLVPVSANVPSVIYPREAIAQGHTDVHTICFAPTTTVVAPPSRDMAAFSAGAVNFCYLSPTVSGQNNNPRQRCESSLAPEPIDSPMTFRVFVSGESVAVDKPSGTLTVNGQSLTETATVQSRQILDSTRGLMYQVPRWDLTFVFNQQCDPSQRYLLTVRGITSYGHQIQVPPVDFDPYTERFQMGLN